MSKASRLTRTIPACVTDVIGRDDSPVAASSTPLALVTIRTVIAFVRIRFRKSLVKIDRNGLPRSWNNNDSAICEESQHPPFYCVTVPTPPRPSKTPARISRNAWQVFLSNRTEADFPAWREQRDWTTRKYALWDAGKRLEPLSFGPGKPAHRFRRCLCGEIFDMHLPEAVLAHVPPIRRHV